MEEPKGNASESASTKEKVINPFAVDNKSVTVKTVVVEKKILEINDDDDGIIECVVLESKNIEVIDVDSIKDTDVTFVTEIRPNPGGGWPRNPNKVEQIYKFRRVLFTSVLSLVDGYRNCVYVNYNLSVGNRTFVQRFLQRINSGYGVKPHNYDEANVLEEIRRIMWYAPYYIDHIVNRRGFTVCKAYNINKSKEEHYDDVKDFDRNYKKRNRNRTSTGPTHDVGIVKKENEPSPNRASPPVRIKVEKES